MGDYVNRFVVFGMWRERQADGRFVECTTGPKNCQESRDKAERVAAEIFERLSRSDVCVDVQVDVTREQMVRMHDGALASRGAPLVVSSLPDSPAGDAETAKAAVAEMRDMFQEF